MDQDAVRRRADFYTGEMQLQADRLLALNARRRREQIARDTRRLIAIGAFGLLAWLATAAFFIPPLVALSWRWWTS